MAEECGIIFSGMGRSGDVVVASRIGESSWAQKRDPGVRWVYGRFYLSGFFVFIGSEGWAFKQHALKVRERASLRGKGVCIDSKKKRENNWFILLPSTHFPRNILNSIPIGIGLNISTRAT